MVGDTASAIEKLESILRTGTGESLNDMELDPLLDSLRETPEY